MAEISDELESQNHKLAWSLFLFGCIMPYRFSLLPEKLPPLCLSDVLLFPLFLWVLFISWRQKKILEYVPHWLLLLFPLTLLTGLFVFTNEPMPVLMKVAQFGLYFWCGGYVFTFAAKQGHFYSYKLIIGLLAGGFGVLIIAWAQYLNFNLEYFWISGGTGHVRMLNVTLALIVPLSFIVLDIKEKFSLFPIIFIIFALPIMFTATGFILTICGYGIILQRVKCVRFKFALIGALLIGLTAWYFLPRNAPRYTAESILPYPSDEELLVKDHKIKQEYMEFQAQFQMWLRYPWTGVGAGRYGKHKDNPNFLGSFPAPAYNDRAKDFHFNQFMLLLATSGTISCVTFLIIILKSIYLGFVQVQREKLFFWGISVSLLVATLSALDTEILVRGLLPIWIMLVAITLSNGQAKISNEIAN